MICEKCNALVEVGSWPFCPHGTRGAATIITDEIPGGQWQENGLKHPMKFYSKSERDRVLAENGCEIRQKWEAPGKLVNWSAGVDAKTLENAAILVSRGTRTVDTTLPPIDARVEWEK